jgi:hypothetical protein
MSYNTFIMFADFETVVTVVNNNTFAVSTIEIDVQACTIALPSSGCPLALHVYSEDIGVKCKGNTPR